MTPQSEAEIADIVREAGARGATLDIVGNGTKRGLGRAAPCDETLDVSALSGIVTYEPEELVLIARAATPAAQINSVLTAKNQMLAFVPADWGPLYGAPPRRATLGGVVATDAAGSRRVAAGAVRDSLIGCRFVNGSGEIIRAGSRVMKNVTGFDVPKLMCGAFGTLGVITEVTFKLAPKPARAAAIALKNLPARDGLAALRRAAQMPLECTGFAHLPKGALSLSAAARDCGLGGARSASIIRVEGAAEPLADKLTHLAQAFAGRDISVIDGEAAELLFTETGDGTIFAGRESGLWRLCVPPSDAADAVDAAGAQMWVADWAGGVLWLELPATLEIATRLRAITTRFTGHATLMRGPADARMRLSAFERETAARAHLTRGVKAAFDPHGVLNPGRMYEEVLMRTGFTSIQLARPDVRAVNHELRKCVHCGFCTAVCPTYVVLGDERDSPRGRMALIQDMLESDAPPAPETVHHLDRCLSCLGCRTICPSTVDYAVLIDTAREHIERKYHRPWPERWFRAWLSFVLTRPGVFAWLLALGRMSRPLGFLLPWNLRAMAAKAPKPKRLTRAHRAVAAPAEPASRVALLPGCVQRVLAPEIDLAARRVLARQRIKAVPLTGTGCCGALSFHMGKVKEAKVHARRLIAALVRPGKFDSVLITATGCAAFLKDYGRVFADEPEWKARAETFASRVRDFADLAKAPDAPRPPKLRVAYQPPCSLQFGQRIAGAGELLLTAAGYALAPIPESHLCCGSAGSYSLTQPELSGVLRARKLEAIALVGPDVIASGNIGCLAQLAGGIPAVHIAELLDWAGGGPRPPAVTDR